MASLTSLRTLPPSGTGTPSKAGQHRGLVEVQPHEVVFEWTPGRDMQGHVHIRNATSQPVAFKIKTTSLEKYRMAPTTGMIDAESTVYVKIVKRAEASFEAAVGSSGGRDRFLVQAVPVDWEGVKSLGASLASRQLAREDVDEHAAMMSFRAPASLAPSQLYIRVRVVSG